MNRIFLALTFSLACLGAPAGQALILDWDAIAWTAGSLSNSYDIDPAKAGNDITVSVTANGGGPFQNELAGGPITPAVYPNFQGGLTATQNTLCIALNLTNTAQSVTVTFSLSSLYIAGVKNVSFSLFDIDYSNASGNTYQDLLSNIRGLSIDGTTLIAPTITTSANNSLSGTGTNQNVTGTISTSDNGAGSGSGNVVIDFGANALKSFTFTYGSGTAFADPTYQHIGVHDISFTPVPEMNPALISVLSCLTAGGLILRHRSRVRK
jgi:hypothetical protein